MKRFGFPVVTGLLAVLLIGLLPALSQDRGERGLQEKWARLHQPGPEHAWLAKDEGAWMVTQRIFRDGTDEPVEVKGEATFTMKWDRYLYEELRIGGVEEANAISYIGFDSSAREFKAVNLGIWSTGLDVISGSRSDDGKTVTMTHESVEKGLDNLKIVRRFVITQKDDDERLVEMFSTYGDAPERKTGEMVYTRKK
jgi:hypothetical protein